MVSDVFAAPAGFTQDTLALNCIRFGNCEIRPRTHEVFVDGQPCHIEPKVFDLVLYLIQERDRVVSKCDLLEHLWGGTIVSDSVIARTIMKARKAIGQNTPEGPFIKTVHCIGYRFVAAVEICNDAAPLPFSATDSHW